MKTYVDFCVFASFSSGKLWVNSATEFCIFLFALHFSDALGQIELGRYKLKVGNHSHDVRASFSFCQ